MGNVDMNNEVERTNVDELNDVRVIVGVVEVVL